MKVKLNELMILERILLEFDSKHKFELDFGDAYNLHQYLTNVGKMTNYAFLIQDEYGRINNNSDDLKKYHKKVMDSVIDYDCSEIVNFIDEICEKVKDEKINEFILNNKFW